MDNAGLYPVDFTSDVGIFRVRISDAQPFEPPTEDNPNCAGYPNWSDEEIQGFIDAAGGDTGSLTRAIAYSYDALAFKLVTNAQLVKDYDLTIDTTKSATQMRELAKEWNERADAEAQAGVEDFLYVVPEWSAHPYLRPEGAPFRWS